MVPVLLTFLTHLQGVQTWFKFIILSVCWHHTECKGARLGGLDSHLGQSIRDRLSQPHNHAFLGTRLTIWQVNKSYSHQAPSDEVQINVILTRNASMIEWFTAGHCAKHSSWFSCYLDSSATNSVFQTDMPFLVMLTTITHLARVCFEVWIILWVLHALTGTVFSTHSSWWWGINELRIQY